MMDAFLKWLEGRLAAIASFLSAAEARWQVWRSGVDSRYPLVGEWGGGMLLVLLALLVVCCSVVGALVSLRN